MFINHETLYITKMSYILERRILLELLFEPKNKAHPNIQKISITISNTQNAMERFI